MLVAKPGVQMETEAGTGELRAVDGSVWLPAARYELTIAAAEILGGLPVIRGSVANPPSGGFAPSLVGADAILQLEDGRQWECTLADQFGGLTARGQ